MTALDLLAKAAPIIVALVALFGLLFAAGKGWAGLAAALASQKALHRRLDEFEHSIGDLKLDIREIQTEIRIRSTLRFRAPELPPAPPTGRQDVFREGE